MAVPVDYYQDAVAGEGWEAFDLEDVTVRADTEITATLACANDDGDTVTVDVADRDGEENTEVEAVVVRAGP